MTTRVWHPFYYEGVETTDARLILKGAIIWEGRNWPIRWKDPKSLVHNLAVVGQIEHRNLGSDGLVWVAASCDIPDGYSLMPDLSIEHSRPDDAGVVVIGRAELLGALLVPAAEWPWPMPSTDSMPERELFDVRLRVSVLGAEGGWEPAVIMDAARRILTPGNQTNPDEFIAFEIRRIVGES